MENALSFINEMMRLKNFYQAYSVAIIPVHREKAHRLIGLLPEK